MTKLQKTANRLEELFSNYKNKKIEIIEDSYVILIAIFVKEEEKNKTNKEVRKVLGEEMLLGNKQICYSVKDIDY